MDGWMDGWMDGAPHAYIHHHVVPPCDEWPRTNQHVWLLIMNFRPYVLGLIGMTDNHPSARPSALPCSALLLLHCPLVHTHSHPLTPCSMWLGSHSYVILLVAGALSLAVCLSD